MIASHILFLFEGCFCFPIPPCFPKHIKFGQNFVTKKPKPKIETRRLVPIYGNKCLLNFSCQRTDKGKVVYGVSKLRTQGTVKSNILILLTP